MSSAKDIKVTPRLRFPDDGPVGRVGSFSVLLGPFANQAMDGINATSDEELQGGNVAKSFQIIYSIVGVYESLLNEIMLFASSDASPNRELAKYFHTFDLTNKHIVCQILLGKPQHEASSDLGSEFYKLRYARNRCLHYTMPYSETRLPVVEMIDDEKMQDRLRKSRDKSRTYEQYTTKKELVDLLELVSQLCDEVLEPLRGDDDQVRERLADNGFVEIGRHKMVISGWDETSKKINGFIEEQRGSTE